MYDVFVVTNETVCYIWVSTERGFTARLLILNQMQVLLPVGRVLHQVDRDQGFNSLTSLASITKTIFFQLILQTAVTNSPFSYRVQCTSFTSPPPKFCITIFFDFSWDDSNTQEKLETMVMQNFGG